MKEEIKEEVKDNKEIKKNKFIPFNEMDDEMKTEITRKGAYASHKKRKENTQIKECLKLLLSVKLNKLKINDKLKKEFKEKFKDLNINVLDSIVLSQVTNALAGDNKSFEIIRDTIGEKPKDEIKVQSVDNDIASQIEMLVSEEINKNNKKNK